MTALITYNYYIIYEEGCLQKEPMKMTKVVPKPGQESEERLKSCRFGSYRLADVCWVGASVFDCGTRAEGFC